MPDIMAQVIIPAVLLAVLLEILRIWCFFAFGLNLPPSGAWRYSYYTLYFAVALVVGLFLSPLLGVLVDRLWDAAMFSTDAVAGIAILISFLTTGLTYAALRKVKEEFSDIAPFLVLSLLVSYLLMRGGPVSHGVLGSLMAFLLTTLYGQLTFFSDWNSLVEWLRQRNEDQEGDQQIKDEIRIRFLIESEGKLSLHRPPSAGEEDEQKKGKDQVEISFLDAPKYPSPLQADEPLLSRIIAAFEELEGREDILDVVPQLIADNLGKLIKQYQSLSQNSKYAGRERDILRRHIRALLDQRLGPEIRSLLYWHYDMPRTEELAIQVLRPDQQAQKVQDQPKLIQAAQSEKGQIEVYAARVARVAMRPIITFRQYLGIWLSLWARRGQG